jgi:hypothetical protein
LNKSQSRQQPYGATFFSLPTAREFRDTSQQTMSNQTGLMSLGLSDFSTADAGKLFTRGDHRPILLKNSGKMEDCFSAEKQSILNFSQQ